MPKHKKKGAKKRKPQSGKGFSDDVKKFFKDNKVISRAVGLIPHPVAQLVAASARQNGWGQTGAGIFSDIGGGLGNIATGVGRGLFGGARATEKVRPGLIQPVVLAL